MTTAFTPFISKGITMTFASLNAQILDVTFPDLKCTPVKTTHQGSTADSSGTIWETYEPSGFADAGSVKFKCNYDASSVAPVGTKGSLVITIPNGSATSTQTYADAILTESSGTGALGQLVTGDLTFKLTGPPVVS